MAEQLRIVTDSTCDLPLDLVERYGITVVPALIRFGNRTYLDGIEITHQELYRRMLEEDEVPKSSQPSPGQFLEVYKELAAEGASILSIHVTAKTSGVWQSASLAHSMLPEADIEVIDSASVSMGTGFIILEAAQAIEAGRSKGEVLALIEDIKSRMNIYATVGTLKYLRLSGRVGHMQGIFGSLLDIKPVITLREGVVMAVDKVRTRKRALDRVLELTKQAVGTEDPVNIAVMHTRVPQEALRFKRRVEESFNCQELMLGEAGIALGVNGGPGVLGIIAYRVDL
ncbi:MAG TPA: DegV family protein [Chloroflexi bacterium]|nr:DegV family protein [Chloroflexota bacterium]